MNWWKSRDSQLEQEMRKHIEFQTRENIGSGMGIGVSTSLFSVVCGVLIAPYPYAKPNEIWAPAVLAPKEKPNGWHDYSRREFTEIQKLPAYSEVMATTYTRVLMTGSNVPQSFEGILPIPDAFHFIGVPPLQSAAMGNGGMPFGGPRSTYSVEGQLPQEAKRVVVGLISSDYVRALGIPLKRGRELPRRKLRTSIISQ